MIRGGKLGIHGIYNNQSSNFNHQGDDYARSNDTDTILMSDDVDNHVAAKTEEAIDVASGNEMPTI